MRVGEEMRAGLHAGVEDDMREKRCVGSQSDVWPDYGISANVRGFADLGGWIDDGMPGAYAGG